MADSKNFGVDPARPYTLPPSGYTIGTPQPPVPPYYANTSSFADQPKVNLSSGAGCAPDGRVDHYPEARINGARCHNVKIVVDLGKVVHISFQADWVAGRAGCLSFAGKQIEAIEIVNQVLLTSGSPYVIPPSIPAITLCIRPDGMIGLPPSINDPNNKPPADGIDVVLASLKGVGSLQEPVAATPLAVVPAARKPPGNLLDLFARSGEPPPGATLSRTLIFDDEFEADANQDESNG